MDTKQSPDVRLSTQLSESDKSPRRETVNGACQTEGREAGAQRQSALRTRTVYSPAAFDPAGQPDKRINITRIKCEGATSIAPCFDHTRPCGRPTAGLSLGLAAAVRGLFRCRNRALRLPLPASAMTVAVTPSVPRTAVALAPVAPAPLFADRRFGSGNRRRRDLHGLLFARGLTTAPLPAFAAFAVASASPAAARSGTRSAPSAPAAGRARARYERRGG